MRVELWPFRTGDGKYARVLAFARSAAKLLAPDFEPPTTELSDDQETKDWEYTIDRKRIGDELRGFDLFMQRDHIDAGIVTYSQDTIRIVAYGLPDAMALALETIRPANHPEFLRSIAVEVEGASGTAVIEAFRVAFSNEPLSNDDLDTITRVASWYSHEPTWALAIERIGLVLDRRPDDPEARTLFERALAKCANPSPNTKAVIDRHRQ